jgi:hypothetical protein
MRTLYYLELSATVSKHLGHKGHGIERASSVERMKNLVGTAHFDELPRSEI